MVYVPGCTHCVSIVTHSGVVESMYIRYLVDVHVGYVSSVSGWCRPCEICTGLVESMYDMYLTGRGHVSQVSGWYRQCTKSLMYPS